MIRFPRGVALSLIVLPAFLLGPALAAEKPAAAPVPSAPQSSKHPPKRTAAQLRSALQARETESGLRIVVPADKLFASEDVLVEQAAALLDPVAELIAASHPRSILVAGHTDGLGQDAANQALSERRAHAVALWLRAHAGRGRFRVTDKGYGRTRPVAPNHQPDGSDNPEGRAQNRRIEIYLRR